MKKGANIRVPYATTSYDEREIHAAIAVLRRPSKMIVAGDLASAFEKRVARIFGKKHGIMVNSGSSANLIALELLGLPRGSEVITPMLTFSTTVAPIIQKGLVPVFADVDPETYQIDVRQIEHLITKKTKALMIPSLIGNLPDFKALRKIADKHKLFFIEDSCDTIGATFGGKPTGSYSDISTTSFYASHILTAAGGGGMLSVHDGALARRARVMSNWGRESTLFGTYSKSEDIKKRFAGRVGSVAYDAKFIFSEIGYNLQASELQAAFGLENAKRLSGFIRKRRNNVKRLIKFFGRYGKFFSVPKELPGTKTAWLAFPLTIRPGAPFTRMEITRHLEEHNIQTRPIFSGNILRQPGFKHTKPVRVQSEGYPVTDYIMQNSFLIGCHHGMTGEMFKHLFKTFTAFLKPYARR